MRKEKKVVIESTFIGRFFLFVFRGSNTGEKLWNYQKDNLTLNDDRYRVLKCYFEFAYCTQQSRVKLTPGPTIRDASHTTELFDF